MCEYGNTKMCRVLTVADDSHTGKMRWDWKPVDSCIAEVVDMLNKYGILTRSCCCGHGVAKSSVILHSGQTLTFPNNT